MYLLLNLCIWIPLAGFIVNSFIPGRKETQLSWTAFVTVGVQGLIFMTLAITWAFSGFPSIDVKEAVLFQTAGYEFFIAFRFDKITAVYALVGSILSFLVTVYSRTYLHREKGYKRFFNNTLFFYTGYNIAIFAGNFETLFIGWEILGIASFLLIAFYRNRYLPVKNAVKVFSIYRIADVGILLVIWMSHHLWHENITFEKLNNYDLVHSQLQSDTLVGVFISLMILLSAAAKSAQLPFSSWLPRAMEGPTPSTAIFYGSLSVHIGVFLLLRTFPFWEH
ncbi:MAG TPA: proton-conducting transporter membrane subunit, partial [Chryseosolibacter sp.]|nr:proton-conducting transporter membrane subunit [Chryseosolibacter sp.]